MNKFISFLFKILVVLIIVVICVYFIITSSFFIRTIALPLIGTFSGNKVSVTSINVSPIRGKFSFDNLKMVRKDALDVKIAHFDSKVNLFDLLQNKITIYSLNLKDSYINITQTASPTEKKQIEESNQVKNENTKSNNGIELYKLYVNNLKVKNFNIVYTLVRKNPQETSISKITNLNLNIPTLKTGGKSILKLSSDVSSTIGNNTISGNILANAAAILNKNGTPKDFDLNANLKLGKDVSPIVCKFRSDLNGKEIPFSLNLLVKNLPLQPFFQAFLKNNYKKTNGYINNLIINATGPDIQSPELIKTLSGNLALTVSNVFIPSTLIKSPIVQLLLIPLHAITRFDKNTSLNLSSTNSDNISSASLDVLRGEKLLEFTNGDVSLIMNNGNMDIKNFVFIGSQNSPIQKLEITGTINKNDEINLKTVTKISAISVPLRIKGTLTKPKAEPFEAIHGILNQNIDTINNVMDAAGSNKSIQKETKNIIDIFTRH